MEMLMTIIMDYKKVSEGDEIDTIALRTNIDPLG